MSDHFTAGPRLVEPRGDASRQAVDALRGYAFQLYASALALLRLGDNEDLYLEVAEDYAVVAAEAMEAVQAKDTTGSGSVTLRTTGVRQAIESLFYLSTHNPDRRVQLRYLSTSPIGEERATTDRIEGQAALLYWEQVSQGMAAMAPLRARLVALGLGSGVPEFLSARTDEELRKELVQRITWDCGRGGVDSLTAEMKAVLGMEGQHGPAVDFDELPQAVSALVEAVLRKAISALPRRLSVADRASALRQATHTSLPTAALRRLLESLPSTARPAQVATDANWLYLISDVHDPDPMVLRQDMVDNVGRALRAHGIAILVGGTGFGKSLIARQSARAVGGDWLVGDLRDIPAGAVRERLTVLLGRGGGTGGGFILDDLDDWGDAAVTRGIAQLLASVVRRGGRLLLTTHRGPTRRTLADLAIGDSALVPARLMTPEEVHSLVAMAGGDAQRWGALVHVSSAGGHPQLGARPSNTLDGEVRG